MIWLYGICDRPDLPPPRRRGLAHAPLDGVREGPLLAVFTRHEHSVGDPAPDALWAHERVVERLMADRTVLPMRFGSTVAGDDAVRRLLLERGSSFLAMLDRLRGRVELGIRVLQVSVEQPVAVAVGPPATGRDYLLAKMQNGRRASGLDDPLSRLAVATRQQPPRSADEVLRGAYLVERPGVARFRTAVERLQRAHPELAILCTGPWPPYSFVGGE
jgi:hypothetical protein